MSDNTHRPPKTLPPSFSRRALSSLSSGNLLNGSVQIPQVGRAAVQVRTSGSDLLRSRRRGNQNGRVTLYIHYIYYIYNIYIYIGLQQIYINKVWLSIIKLTLIPSGDHASRVAAIGAQRNHSMTIYSFYQSIYRKIALSLCGYCSVEDTFTCLENSKTKIHKGIFFISACIKLACFGKRIFFVDAQKSGNLSPAFNSMHTLISTKTQLFQLNFSQVSSFTSIFYRWI